MNPPPDIKRGDLITHEFLNQSKNSGVLSISAGPGITANVSNGVASVGNTRDIQARRSWQPRRYLVKAEHNDYLECAAYDGMGTEITAALIKVAKPLSFRGDTELWGVTPPYVPDTSIVWAAPLGANGATDLNDDPILLVDLNLDGRSAATFWARITGNVGDGQAGYRYAWVEVERTADGFQDMVDGRSGTVEDDGGFARNTFEEGWSGDSHASPIQNQTIVLLTADTVDIGGTVETTYNFEHSPYETGFGIPVMGDGGSENGGGSQGETDLPISSTLNLTVTSSTGTPILDADGEEQTIRVWRNTLRRPLYLDFVATDVFFYVKYPGSQNGVSGCLFSRTEGMATNSSVVPSGGIQLNGAEVAPQAVDGTGDPSDSGHVFVEGDFYYRKSGSSHGEWVPWFTIDPESLSVGDELVAAADGSVPGFLSDVLVVAAGDEHLSLTPAGDTVEVAHVGPGGAVVSIAPVDGYTSPSSGVIRLNANTSAFDARGHGVVGSSVATSNDVTHVGIAPVVVTTSAAGGSATVTYAIDWSLIPGYDAAATSPQSISQVGGVVSWINSAPCPQPSGGS